MKKREYPPVPKVCVVCGADYTARHQRAKYCPGCRKEMERKTSRERRQRIAENKAEPKHTLNDLLKELSQKKMSYADYQRQQTLRKEGHHID